MQYLAILKLKPDTSTEKLGPHMRPEAAKAWEMLASGVLRSLHFIQGGHGPAGAALLLECATQHEAENHLKSLPLVEHNLATVEVLALTPFTGFAMLFASPAT